MHDDGRSVAIGLYVRSARDGLDRRLIMREQRDRSLACFRAHAGGAA